MDTHGTDSGYGRGGFASDVNVGTPERIASVVSGALVALFGMRRGGLSGSLMTLSGGGMLVRGLTGHCPLYGTLGINTAESFSDPSADPYGYGRRDQALDKRERPERPEPTESGPESRSFELRADEGGTSGRSTGPTGT